MADASGETSETGRISWDYQRADRKRVVVAGVDQEMWGSWQQAVRVQVDEPATGSHEDDQVGPIAGDICVQPLRQDRLNRRTQVTASGDREAKRDGGCESAPEDSEVGQLARDLQPASAGRLRPARPQCTNLRRSGRIDSLEGEELVSASTEDQVLIVVAGGPL